MLTDRENAFEGAAGGAFDLHSGAEGFSLDLAQPIQIADAAGTVVIAADRWRGPPNCSIRIAATHARLY